MVGFSALVLSLSAVFLPSATAFLPSVSPGAVRATSLASIEIGSSAAVEDWSSVPVLPRKQQHRVGAEGRAVLQQVFGAGDSSVVLFDGECNFCNAGIWTVLAHSEADRLRFAGQETETGTELLKLFNISPANLRSIAVVCRDGHLLTNSRAVLEIGKRMHAPFPVLAEVAGRVVPEPLLDAAYAWVSANRHVFGHSDACRIPEDEEMERFLMELPMELPEQQQQQQQL